MFNSAPVISSQYTKTDFKVNDVEFIAVARSVLHQAKFHRDKKLFTSVPHHIRVDFQDALKHRKDRLPMFPDPGETEAVRITRELANMFPPQLPPVRDSSVS